MISNYTENACSCPTCQNMCKHCPCIGTPEDILKIIQAGQSHGLCHTRWGTGLVNGAHDTIIEMIQPRNTENGCAYLDDKNLCTLHDLGLKPTEGRLTNHAEYRPESFKDSVNYIVAMTWVDEDGNNDPREMILNTAKRLKS